MASDPIDFSEELREPSIGERFASVKRAAKALVATRLEIFREELAAKGALFSKAAAGLVIALAFAALGLVLLTALVAAVFARLLGGPIAGIAAALVLYLAIAAAGALFGLKTMRRVRFGDFPATRDEMRKDLDAVKKKSEPPEEEVAVTSEVLAAERASMRPGESEDEREERLGEDHDEHEHTPDFEDRFRAGSE
jgi:uncharacterized membrane protein YqjE